MKTDWTQKTSLHTLVFSQIKLPSSLFFMIKVSRSNKSTSRQVSYLSFGLRKNGSRPAIAQPRCSKKKFPGRRVVKRVDWQSLSLLFQMRGVCLCIKTDPFFYQFLQFLFTAPTTSLEINKKINTLAPLCICDCCIFPQRMSDWQSGL